MPLPDEFTPHPETRAERLRRLFGQNTQGVAPGIAGSAPRATPGVAPGSYDGDPYFDDQVAQDERAAYSPWTPSSYRAHRAEDQLWEADLDPGLQVRRRTDPDTVSLD
ncbi:MAG: hypothetical protein O3A10_15065 [Chloroflexi bacterium]|nr:hypothetical protein [Chloroflexota bacterium]MDA1145775.1 hypothetical protein [Chloroflexota bacterium]